MEIADIIRTIVIVGGVLLLCLDFFSFVHRRLTEGIGIAWALFAVVLILVGAVPGLSAWSTALCAEGYVAFFLVGFLLVLGMFLLSQSISQLIMKNQELAMQVSLLNQENESILSALEELTGKNTVQIEVKRKCE